MSATRERLDIQCQITESLRRFSEAIERKDSRITRQKILARLHGLRVERDRLEKIQADELLS